MNISEAASQSGVSAKMIRHYEETGIIPKPARTFSNYRRYQANDVHRLRFVKRARELGFSTAEIKELLGLWQNKSRSSAAVKKIAARHIGELEQKMAQMQSMLKTLRHLSHHCHGDERPECPILDDLAKP
jgi:Cu(I)-responsive transcriptional regulator